MFCKKQKILSYNKENQKPILKCSICNGEQVAGLKDIHTGKFDDIMIIKNTKDLDAFKKMVGVSEIPKEY